MANRSGTWRHGLLVAVLSAGASTATGLEARVADGDISNLTVSRSFFNPSLGQTIGISLTAARPGILTVRIQGPNGQTIRNLASGQPIHEGHMTLQWDGRDARGAVVPDDAYGLKVLLETSTKTSSYFAPESSAALAVRMNGYDRRSAVISYSIPKPGRVRILARTRDPKTGGTLTRLVARDQPRTAGAVIDVWDGFDDSHRTYLPDLPGFELVVTATELPETAILTVGTASSLRIAEAARDRRAERSRTEVLR